MRFTTVGKEILKGARQAQKLEAARSEGPKVAERLREIKLVEALRKAKKDWKEIQEPGVSPAAPNLGKMAHLAYPGEGGAPGEQTHRRADACPPGGARPH